MSANGTYCSGSYIFGTQCGDCMRCTAEVRDMFNHRYYRVNGSTKRLEFSDEYKPEYGFVGDAMELRRRVLKDHYFNLPTGTPQNRVCTGYCAPCGIAANVLTCLRKYARPPKDLAFTVSTMHEGVCCHCGEVKMVTEARDYFYPDFSLLTSAENTAKQALSGKNDPLQSPTSPSGNES